MDKYADKYMKALKKCKRPRDFKIVIDKIYHDGLQDGINEYKQIIGGN